MSSTFARRAFIAAALLMFTAMTGAAQTTKTKTDDNATKGQVRAAQEEMLQAAIQGNKDEVARFLADNVSWVALNGRVESKDEVLGALPAPVASVDVQEIVPEGAGATLVATVHLKDGTERRAMQQWIKNDGQWQVLAHQSTPINAQASTAPSMGMTPPEGAVGTGGAAMEARTVEPTLNSDVERAIWKAQTEIVNAYSKGDTKTYSRLTANPFTRIETSGQVYNRSQWLDLVGKNAKQPLKPSAVSDVQITVDKADNTARATMEMVGFGPDGAPGRPERQTRIFALRNGQWQQVAAISTPIAEK